jgi:hypothetical protein
LRARSRRNSDPVAGGPAGEEVPGEDHPHGEPTQPPVVRARPSTPVRCPPAPGRGKGAGRKPPSRRANTALRCLRPARNPRHGSVRRVGAATEVPGTSARMEDH